MSGQNGGDVHFTPPWPFGRQGAVNEATFTSTGGPPPFNPPQLTLDEIRQRPAAAVGSPEELVAAIAEYERAGGR